MYSICSVFVCVNVCLCKCECPACYHNISYLTVKCLIFACSDGHMSYEVT